MATRNSHGQWLGLFRARSPGTGGPEVRHPDFGTGSRKMRSSPSLYFGVHDEVYKVYNVHSQTEPHLNMKRQTIG